MDIELAVDAMEMAPHIDHMVLFSGDGDFRSLVEAVQRRGVRVTVVSTISTQPPMVADELRRQADQFVDIIELQTEDRTRSRRAPAARAARGARAARAHGTRRNSCSAARPRTRGVERRTTTSSKTIDATMRPSGDGAIAEPGRDCPRCPRLVAFRETLAGA